MHTREKEASLPSHQYPVTEINILKTHTMKEVNDNDNAADSTPSSDISSIDLEASSNILSIDNNDIIDNADSISSCYRILFGEALVLVILGCMSLFFWRDDKDGNNIIEKENEEKDVIKIKHAMDLSCQLLHTIVILYLRVAHNIGGL